MSCAIINAPLSLISLSTKLGEGLELIGRITLSLSKGDCHTSGGASRPERADRLRQAQAGWIELS